MKKIHLEIDIKTVDNSKLVNGYEKISHCIIEIDPIKFSGLLAHLSSKLTMDEIQMLLDLNRVLTDKCAN